MHNPVIRSRDFALLVFAFAVACGGTKPPTSAAHAQWPLTPEEEAALVEAVAPSSPTDRFPASKWTIDGETVSEISPPRIVETLIRAGWTNDGAAVRSEVGERFESWAIPIRKGLDAGRFRIARPVARPIASAMVVSDSPGRLPDAADKNTTAYVFDADAQVYVEIEIRGHDSPTKAKELLESVLRRKP